MNKIIFIFAIFFNVFIYSVVSSDDTIDISPYYLCRHYSAFTANFIVVVTYISDGNYTIPHGADNFMKLGTTLVGDDFYPTEFNKNDNIPISFPLANNFNNDRRDFLFYLNVSNNPHNIPLDSNLFSPDTMFASSSFTNWQWKINSNTSLESWYDDAPLCCTSQCSYLSTDLQCMTYDDEIFVVSYSVDRENGLITAIFNTTTVPYIVFSYINNYAGLEPNETHIPYDPDSYYFYFMTSNGFPSYHDSTDSPQVWEWIQTFYLPYDYTPDQKFIFCINSNCAYDCLILDLPPSPSPTRTPSKTISKTRSLSKTPSISLTKTPSITPSVTSSSSITPSISLTKTPTISITPTITSTVTPTISITPSVSPSASNPCVALSGGCTTNSQCCTNLCVLSVCVQLN